MSSTGTFWDTVVVCAMTGLVIVNSGEWMTGARGAALTKAAFADITNGLMAIPNLISLLALQGVIVAETRHYLWNKNLDADSPEADAG